MKDNRKPIEIMHVLVVDDEPVVRNGIQRALQNKGISATLASKGQEALDLIAHRSFDLVLLDINMPKKSGVRMYRELKEDETLASIPVIIVTAVTGYGGNPEEFHRLIASRKHVPPPEGFVAKPIEREAFLNLVRQIIGH